VRLNEQEDGLQNKACKGSSARGGSRSYCTFPLECQIHTCGAADGQWQSCRRTILRALAGGSRLAEKDCEKYSTRRTVFNNALARKQFEETLTSRLQFEALLNEISARFINLPADHIDEGIEDSQRLICECLEIDMSVLWQGSDEMSQFLTVTHVFSPPGGPVPPERMDAQEAFPWSLKRVLAGVVLVISTEKLPPEAARGQETPQGEIYNTYWFLDWYVTFGADVDRMPVW